MMLYTAYYRSPYGTLITAVDVENKLVRLLLPREDSRWQAEIARKGYTITEDEKRCDLVLAQLDEYFQRKRQTFDVPLRMEGTDFQKQVWSALQTIPYGTTTNYKTLATWIGNPAAMRAVGMANGQNPIPIIVPCHRVIGANGSLTGFGGGLELKAQLLQLEGIRLC